MKKIIAFCLVLIFVFALACPSVVYADPMTIAQLSSLAFGIGQASGITWGFPAATPEGVNRQMSAAINKWLAGRSIAEAFGSEMARAELGKLWVPAQLYNGIRSFLNDFIAEHSLETGEQIVFPGEIDGTILDNMYSDFEFSDTGFSTTQTASSSKLIISTYYNGTKIGGYTLSHGSSSFQQCVGWTINYVSSNNINIVYLIEKTQDGETTYYTHQYSKTVTLPEPSSRGTANIDEGYMPTVLYPDQEWTGTVGGYDYPDINIDDLLGGIDEAISIDDLDIEGEIVDPVVPPTPVPTFPPPAPDIPLQDVPWGGLNDLIGQTGKDITDSIDDLKDQTAEGVQDITGSIEGVQEGISDLTDTISEALTPPEIDERTFDLRELFPFCIPFDIYHLLQKFDGSPVAPHVQLPFVIQSLGFSYTLDLDFSAWDPVASVMRTVELIVYALGLAWATSKVIKW